jgi:hypothetical protein
MLALGKIFKCCSTCHFIQIYSVSEGYLQKIPVERRGKFPERPQRRGKLDCPRNRYFSQITLTNRICLFNSAECLTASKTVTCKQVQNFRPPRSFYFQDFYQSRKTGKIFSKMCISGTKSKIEFCCNIKIFSNIMVDSVVCHFSFL